MNVLATNETHLARAASRTATVIVAFCVAAGGCGSDGKKDAPRVNAAKTQARPLPPPRTVRVDPPATPGAMAPALVSVHGTVLGAWLERVEDDGAARDGGPAKTTKTTTRRLRVATLRGTTWSKPTTIAEGPNLVANWADVPVLGVAGDGSVVASWAASSGKGVYSYDVRLARSTTRGTTWTQLGVAHTARVPAEYGFVSMVREGMDLRAFWLDGRATVPRGGAMTLRTAVVGRGVTGEELVDDRVCDCCGTAAALTDAGPVVVYRNRTKDEIRDIWIARRVGGTWTAPKPVHGDEWKIAGCPVNGPAIAARGMSVVVAWYTYAGDTPRVRVAFSRDAGATFDAPIDVDGPTGKRAPLGRVGVVMTATDGAVVSWMTTVRETASIRLRRVAAGGKLGAEHVLATLRAGRSAGFPRIVQAGNDLLVMWTEPGEQSHVRALSVPLSLVPALGAKAQPTAKASESAAAPTATDMAPAIAASTLEGKPVTLASLRGAPVLLNVWATWCEPCRREIPALMKIARQYKNKGLRVVGLSVDRERSRADIKRFVDRRKVSYTIWHDDKDAASSALGVGILPATYLIDAAGRIVWRHSGAITADDPRLHAALRRVFVGRRTRKPSK